MKQKFERKFHFGNHLYAGEAVLSTVTTDIHILKMTVCFVPFFFIQHMSHN